MEQPYILTSMRTTPYLWNPLRYLNIDDVINNSKPFCVISAEEGGFEKRGRTSAAATSSYGMASCICGA
jgi:hypothetical protein